MLGSSRWRSLAQVFGELSEDPSQIWCLVRAHLLVQGQPSSPWVLPWGRGSLGLCYKGCNFHWWRLHPHVLISPRAPPLNTTMLWIRFQHNNFKGAKLFSQSTQQVQKFQVRKYQHFKWETSVATWHCHGIQWARLIERGIDESTCSQNTCVVSQVWGAAY